MFTITITLLIICWIVGSDDCIGSKFIQFTQDNVPDSDPPIPYKFQFSTQRNYPQEDVIYEHGTTFQVFCPEGMDYAYPWRAKSLICDNGEIKQNDVSKYNHCISYNKCSAAYFDRDWVIKGYRLNSRIDNLLDDGPLITRSIPFSVSIEKTMRKYGKKLPNTIISKYSDETLSHNTYPPLLLLTCDILYTSFSVNPDVYKPHAYCMKKAKWKKAKWCKGKSDYTWNQLHSVCTKIVKLSIKKSPPPQGCTVLSNSRAECIAYKKYCGWDELKKYKTHFDGTKVDIRICTQQCAPWSCYSSLTMPIVCSKARTMRECTKLIPAFAYWCEWDIKEQICSSKKIKKESKDYPVQTDVCTTDNHFCKRSEDEDFWLKQDVIFSGAIKRLSEIRFGYEYKIFGIRHVIRPLSNLAEMRGSVITSVRATHEINDADPTEATLDAAVIIEPNQIKTKFGIVTRKKYQMLSSLFNLKNVDSKRSKSRKPVPDYNYVSIELKSDELETPTPPISFDLSTYTSSDCKRCKLEKYKTSGINSKSKTITNILYVIDIEEPVDAITYLQFPNMNKANVKIKMKVTIEPGPERCGKNDIGCSIILEPIMNDAFSSLFEFKCNLPIRARLLGYDNSVITIFGVKPNKRREVTSKYSVRVAKSDQFVAFEGQTATLRWKIDMGVVKSILIKSDDLATYENIVQKPIKIEFKQFDTLKTRPDKTKWILLTSKKTLPKDCSIQYNCNKCGVEIKPARIRIRKGFKRLRLRVTARIPGDFQIHFTVIGTCGDLVANPPSLLMEVFQPDAGFVKVPEILGPVINGEWSQQFDISITRPPFRTELKLKPLTNEFVTNPLQIRFNNIKRTMIQESATSLAALGITNDAQIKIMPSLECGGGPPRELRWTLSGAIEEFYAPHSTFVTVQSADTDDDFCKYKQLINQSNGTNISFGFMDEEQAPQIPEQVVPEWRFEYYLIGGAITICILVVINQFKEQKFDRMIAIMSGALQT